MTKLRQHDEFFDRVGMTDEAYGDRRPLVKKGEDRDEVLEEIIEKWLTPSGASGIDRAAVEDHYQRGGFVLDHYAFVDENTNEPIDLDIVLQRIEDRLRELGEPEEFRSRPDLFILLRYCRIDACYCRSVKVRPRFVAFETKFADKSDFVSAQFGDGAEFGRCHFADETSFESATFGDEASFERATFGNEVNFHATFGEGATFSGTAFGTKADFGNAKFGDRAEFEHVECGDDALFVGVAFGNRPTFRVAKFGANAYFEGSTFGNDADFSGAEFGAGARFDSAGFGPGAKFVATRLPNAHLRKVRGFVPDETYTRGSHFSIRPDDLWSALRNAYTGPRVIFNLMFLIIFLLPYFARTAGWYAIGQAQQEALVAIDSLNETLAFQEREHPELATFTRSQIETLRRNLPGGEEARWRESRVWRAVLGVDKGAMFLIPALLLLTYNLARGLLTFIVAPMRDAEERTGYTPILRPKSFAGVLGSYGWLNWPHRAVRVLLWVAIASFLWTAWKWLTLPLWLPV